MSDLISRAELLKVVTGEDFKADFPRMSKSLKTIIQALPSVQPMWIENSKGERIALDKVGADKAVKILEILGK